MPSADTDTVALQTVTCAVPQVQPVAVLDKCRLAASWRLHQPCSCVACPRLVELAAYPRPRGWCLMLQCPDLIDRELVQVKRAVKHLVGRAVRIATPSGLWLVPSGLWLEQARLLIALRT